MELPHNIIGLTPEKARELLPEHKIRIAIKDGNLMIGTREYRPNRLNVAVENGVIVKVTSIG